MPYRDAEDNTRYGIDPCWQHEALSVWSGVAHGRESGEKYKIYRTPRAADINRIRSLLPTWSGYYAKGKPPTGIVSQSALESELVTAWGDVPPSVFPGDLVRRVDISAVYDYMRPVKGVLLHRSPSTLKCVTAFQTAFYRPDWTGYEPPPISTPSNALYRYENDYSTGAFSYQNGWTRWTATASNALSVTLPDRRNEWIDGVSLWVKVNGDYTRASGTSESKTAFVSVAATAGWTGGDLHISAHPPIGEVNAILAHFGWTEGEQNAFMSLGVTGVAVYLAIDSAYTV